jgi:hypothetical protein
MQILASSHVYAQETKSHIQEATSANWNVSATLLLCYSIPTAQKSLHAAKHNNMINFVPLYVQQRQPATELLR